MANIFSRFPHPPQAPVQRRAQSLAYINGYAVPGERSTGLKPEVSAPPPAPDGSGDHAADVHSPKFVAFDRKVRSHPRDGSPAVPNLSISQTPRLPG